MNKIGFSFLSAFLLFITISTGLDTIEPMYQLLGALIMIVFIGIPHGAIDHILFLEDNNSATPLHFYGFYFGLMGLYLISWFVFPILSLIVFLILSAYHFGQSQFSELSANKRTTNRLLYLSWGVSILSGLMYYNLSELNELTALSADTMQLAIIFDSDIFGLLLILSSFIAILMMLFTLKQKEIALERFFFEIYLLALIHICFYVLPLIIGFTLYFVILHSMKVLFEEFDYLKARRNNFSIRSFIKLLIPFSLISILFAVLILLCAHYAVINISLGLLFLVLISVLTLPHSFVMDNFYQKFMQRGLIN